MRPHVLDFRFEPRLRALPRALEGHVLQEVGHPVVLLCLVPAARIDPHPDRRRRPVARLLARKCRGLTSSGLRLYSVVEVCATLALEADLRCLI